MEKQSRSTTSTRSDADSARGRPRKNGSWRKLVPYAVGAALLGAMVYGFLPKPIAVEIAKVGAAPLTVSVLEEGKTRIRHRYTISPPIGGFLNRVELRAGAPIEKGKTVLATIQPQLASFLDPRSRAEAEARVKGAESARLRAEAEVERARESLALAEKERVRSADLKAKGVASQKEFDIAQSQAAMSGRELRAAEFALEVAGFERAQADAALMQSQSPGDTTAAAKPVEIVAPVNGFVLSVFEESARVVAQGTPVMEVGDPADLEAEIELLSSDAVGVRPGAPVTIEQWGGSAPLRGSVTLVEPGGYTKISALGVEEQRVKVRVNFTEAIPPEHPLGDRFRVEARIVTWQNDRVLQVPTGALFRRGGDWMAFLFDGGKARLTKVEIAHNNGVAAEVLSGLSEGQRVLLHPPDTVADSAAVKAR